MQTLGRNRFLANESRQIRGRFKHHPSMRVVMKRTTRLLLMELRAVRKAKKGTYKAVEKWLLKSNAVAAAALTARVLFDDCLQTRVMKSVANSIGHAISTDALFREWRRTQPTAWQYTVKRARKTGRKFLRHLWIEKHMPYMSRHMSYAEETRLGVYMLEMAVRLTGLFTIDCEPLMTQKSRSVLRLNPKPQLLEFIENARKCLAGSAVFLLPIHKLPRPWKSMTEGGYHELAGRSLLDMGDARAQKIVAEGKTEKVRNVATILQEVPWRVNGFTLAVARKLRDKGHAVGDLEPPRDLDGSDCYDIAGHYPRSYADERLEAMVRRQRRKSSWALSLIRRAEMMGTSPFYYPTRIDFRGRYYTQAAGLSIQSGDLSRSLLTFGRPEPIGDGFDTLKIHGANCWGLSRKPLDERVRWVDDNAAEIAKAAKYADINTWWREAKEPWQFLAFCQEFRKVHKVGSSAMVQIPCIADATSNSIQIASLLLGNPEMGARVNVMPSDAPQDVYTVLCGVLRDELTKLPQHEPAKRWLDVFEGGPLDRDLVKIPAMIATYGGSSRSVMGRLIEWQHDNYPAHPALYRYGWRSCSAVAKIVWHLLRRELAPMMELTEWLRKVGREFHVEPWPYFESPTGLRVVMRYNRGKSRQIVCSTGSGRYYSPRQQDLLDENVPQDVARAMPANFLHAMDAACVTSTAMAARDAGITQMAFIHDCVVAPASRMDELKALFRGSYADLFQADLLGDLRRTVGDSVPEPPTRGSLAAESVRHSTYFLS